jgi:hypothetical protein
MHSQGGVNGVLGIPEMMGFFLFSTDHLVLQR